ncbi:MAG: YkvA family protein [Candidatus Binatia bacterium]
MMRIFPPMARAAGDAAEIVARAAAVAVHLRRVDPRRFRQLIGRVHLALQCLRDVARGAYPQLPWKTVAMLIGALSYFLAPADALPDLVPLSGFLDDAAVMSLLFGAVEADLRAYCAWRGMAPEAFFDDPGAQAQS